MLNIGINFLDKKEISRIKKENSETPTYLINKEVVDGEKFYQSIRKNLPQDPPLQGSSLNWDALADSVWGGIFNLKRKTVFIVWNGHEEMKKNDKGNYLIACETFNSMARSLNDPRYTKGSPIKLLILMSI